MTRSLAHLNSPTFFFIYNISEDVFISYLRDGGYVKIQVENRYFNMLDCMNFDLGWTHIEISILKNIYIYIF